MNMRCKHVISLILTTVLVFSLLPFDLIAHAATAEGEGTEGISKSKTSSKYELSEGDDITEITLSLPSEEYLDTFDILFVVDSSNKSEQWEPQATELMDSLLETDLNVNVGVIKFKGRPQDTIDAVSEGAYSELTALSDDSRTYIEQAMEFNPDTDERSTTGNGTNIHSALLLAQKWLDASDTPADHKYVLLFTDGRAYIYDDGNGTPTGIYAQYHRAGVTPNRLMSSGKPTISSTSQADKYHVGITGASYIFSDTTLDEAFRNKIVRFGTAASHSAADFQLLYDSTNSELTGTSPYESYCYYVDSGAAKVGSAESTVDIWPASNFSTYFKSGSTLFSNYYNVNLTDQNVKTYLELCPLEGSYDEASGGYVYSNKLNEDYWMFHVSSEEKALYLAGHAWTDLGEGAHTIAITNDRGYNSGLETCKDFLAWLPENSELSAAIGNTESVAAVFSELENQIVYVVGKAVVTDEIPSYLDLVEDAYDGIPFQVTLDGEALAVTELGDGSWGFGTPNEDGIYPYTVTWDAGARTFTFNINVPVENAHPVKLNYELQWNGTGDEEVDVDTNASTTIEYWPSNDPDGESKTEAYTSPVVIYHSYVTYTVTKEWDDKDDADGIRPTSVSVQLYADGEATGEAVSLDASGDWTYTWEKLAKNADGEAIEYTVEEKSVPEGYTATYVVDDDANETTVTNTHTPKEPKPTPTPTPKPKPKKPARRMPKMGDGANPMALMIVSVLGAAAIGVSLYLKRREHTTE